MASDAKSRHYLRMTSTVAAEHVEVAQWQRKAALFVFLSSTVTTSALWVLLASPVSLLAVGVAALPYLVASALPLFMGRANRFRWVCMTAAVITGVLCYGPLLWELVSSAAPTLWPLDYVFAAYLLGGLAFFPCAPLLLLLALTSPPSPERQMLGLLVSSLGALVIVGWLFAILIVVFAA